MKITAAEDCAEDKCKGKEQNESISTNEGKLITQGRWANKADRGQWKEGIGVVKTKD